MGKTLVEFDWPFPVTVFNVTRESPKKLYGEATFLPGRHTSDFAAFKRDLYAEELTFDCACGVIGDVREKLRYVVLCSASEFVKQGLSDLSVWAGLPTKPETIEEMFTIVGNVVANRFEHIDAVVTWFKHKFLKWDTYDFEEHLGLMRSLYKLDELRRDDRIVVLLPSFLSSVMCEEFYGG